MEEFAGVALRLEQEGGSRGIAQAFEHLIQERRLAQARLSDQRQKTPSAQDSLCERVERLAVRPGGIQIRRVGRDAKRLLTQVKEIEKHRPDLHFAAAQTDVRSERSVGGDRRATARISAGTAVLTSR